MDTCQSKPLAKMRELQFWIRGQREATGYLNVSLSWLFMGNVCCSIIWKSDRKIDWRSLLLLPTMNPQLPRDPVDWLRYGWHRTGKNFLELIGGFYHLFLLPLVLTEPSFQLNMLWSGKKFSPFPSTKQESCLMPKHLTMKTENNWYLILFLWKGFCFCFLLQFLLTVFYKCCNSVISQLCIFVSVFPLVKTTTDFKIKLPSFLKKWYNTGTYDKTRICPALMQHERTV